MNGSDLRTPVGGQVSGPDRPLVVRPRLLDVLARRWSVRAIVLSSPAGYGKTTLLAQAVAADAAAPLRVDVPLSCEAAGDAAPVLGELVCRAVEAPHPAAHGPAAHGAAEIARAVGDALRRRSPQHVCLVLDGVGTLTPGGEAAALLASVVAALPGNGHAVLAGRRVPLDTGGLDGDIVRLDESDLAFSDGEVADFAALRGVPWATVAGCHGWPALAELHASGRPGLADAYLEQVVLAPLPPERRRALALLAHVGPFDGDVAEAVLGPGGDVSDVVAGIPLVTRQPDGRRAVDALWRPLLAADVTPAEVAAARRRAARRLREQGRPAAAIPLLLDADEVEAAAADVRPADGRGWPAATVPPLLDPGAADATAHPGAPAAMDDPAAGTAATSAAAELGPAIVDALGPVRPAIPHDVMAGWFARLPAGVRASPSGWLLAGMAAVEADPAGAQQRLEDAADGFRAAGDAAGELASLLHLGELAWRSERPERLAAVATRVFELEAHGCEEAVPVACVGRALLLDFGNDSRGMLAELDRIRPGDLRDAWQSMVDSLRSMALLQLGDAEAAVEHAERALVHAGPGWTAFVGATRLQALWSQGRITDVLHELPGFLERIEGSGTRQAVALVAAHGCLAHAFLGQRAPAADHLARAQASAASLDLPTVHTALAAAEAALAVADGDEAAAAAVLAEDLARRPPEASLSAAPPGRSLALTYVLAPATRPAWDRADLGPAFAAARDLARAVVAVREGGRLPPDLPQLPGVDLTRAHLPQRWVAELGMAAVAAGREDGATLVEATWPAIHPAVAAMADVADPPLRAAARATLGRLAVEPARRLELRLLGPLELRRDGVPIQGSDWRRERVRSLLAYLALMGPTSRQRLAGDLWPGLDAVGQQRNLRVNLTYLLRVLEPDRGQRDASFFVRQDGTTVRLHPGGWLTVDVWEFDAACERADGACRRGSPSEALDHALAAADLWRGDATELASAPWAVAPLEVRRVRVATTATTAGRLLLARGRPHDARRLAERALAIDPWLDGAHRLAVAGCRAAGDRPGERRARDRYRDALDELGLGPG